MMILKKRKKIIPILAFLFAFVLALFAFISFLPRKSVYNKADASFAEDGYQNVRLSIDIVYFDDTTLNISYNMDSADFEPFRVTHGFSLSDILNSHNVLTDIGAYRVSDIYVAMFFDDKPFNSARYDIYFSEQRAIYTGLSKAFEYQTNAVLTIDFEEFLPPLTTFRAYRAVLPNDGWLSNGRMVSSFVYQLKVDFFEEMARPYAFGYLDYCVFVYDKNTFTDYNTAYQQGYEGGYDYGYNQGYSEGKETGQRQGYNNGYNKGLQESNKFTGLLSSMFDVPVQTFYGMLNFDILGINVADFITSFFTISLVIWLIRKFF